MCRLSLKLPWSHIKRTPAAFADRTDMFTYERGSSACGAPQPVVSAVPARPVPLEDAIAETVVDGEDDDDATAGAAPVTDFRVRTMVWLWRGWRVSVQGPSTLQRRRKRPLVMACHNTSRVDRVRTIRTEIHLHVRYHITTLRCSILSDWLLGTKVLP